MSDENQVTKFAFARLKHFSSFSIIIKSFWNYNHLFRTVFTQIRKKKNKKGICGENAPGKLILILVSLSKFI